MPEPLTATALPAERNCKPVAATCFAVNDNLSIGLRLASQVQPLRPFSVEVKLEGPQALAIQRVAVHFIMPGMEMGVNRFLLTRQPDDGWLGEAMLPACATGRRDWLATVEAEGKVSSYIGTFTVIADP